VLVREAPLTHRRRFSGRGCGSPPGGSRWVEAEQWRPNQKLSKLDSGELELEVPYHDARELVGDVLRYVSVHEASRVALPIGSRRRRGRRQAWSDQPAPVPPPGDTTFGSVDYRDPHIVLSECLLDAVRSGQQGCKHSVIGGITNGQTNKFRPVSPRGDQALEVIILGAQHEALIRSEIAQLRIRGALQAQQGDLAGSGKSIL